jgi:hypothetical protein
MNDKAPLSSLCPKCHQLRVMDGYSRDDLRRLLNTGGAIEGWCSTCGDQHWTLSEQERAAIAKGLAEGL